MSTAQLNATARTESGKGAARKIRQSGNIPAVIYGSGREPASITTNARETERLLTRISTSSTVIELSIDGKISRTLIREIQRHPFKRHVMHIDFQELVVGEAITVRVPIIYVGTPDGVRHEGGHLDQILHDLLVETLPTNIPNHIDVDVTSLTLGKSLHVSDIVLPSGVKVMEDLGTTLCVVHASKGATDTTAADAEPSAAEPELIRKVKPDDE